MSYVQQMITRVLEHAGDRPMFEVMRQDERDLGNTVIVPGEVPWLAADDWHHTIIVSQRGKDIRLVAIFALRHGTGIFRRTVAGILDAGLVPVIIAPTLEMRATMKRWNWARRAVGSGWNVEEQWRPRKGWHPLPHSINEQVSG